MSTLHRQMSEAASVYFPPPATMLSSCCGDLFSPLSSSSSFQSVVILPVLSATSAWRIRGNTATEKRSGSMRGLRYHQNSSDRNTSMYKKYFHHPTPDGHRTVTNDRIHFICVHPQQESSCIAQQGTRLYPKPPRESVKVSKSSASALSCLSFSPFSRSIPPKSPVPG